MNENRVRIVIEVPAAQAVQGVGQVVNAVDGLGVSATGAGQKLDATLTITTVKGPQAAQGVRQVDAALDGMGTAATGAGQKLDTALTSTTAKTQQAAQGLKAVGSDAATSGKTAQASVTGLGDSLAYVRTLAAQIAPMLVAAFGADQVISFASQVVGAAVAMEQLAATYKAVFKDGSAEQLRYAAGMADAFGKSLLDVAGAYKKFAAASEAVGLSTDNQRRTFEAVTASITKVGGTSQDVSGALLALEQMLSKGTVQAEEYRQQFAERIPGALKMGADALGVTTAAFQKMMENGEVISNDFIPKLTTQLEKFGDGWQATADTAAANAERLKNSFLELSNSPALTGFVTVVEKVGTAFNKNLTHNLEQFTVTYRALMAEAKGELSPFATWSNSLEDLKKQLDALDQRKATYVKDLKDQAQGLAEALVKVQTHQVDFGPSGETVDQLRAKLKWFQEQITTLTGQTWVVNVVAQVDNSQLIQAKAYIQDLIKGTTEYKTRSLEAKQYALDNAVNIVASNKTTVETKLANPNLDLREADALSRELQNLNGQLADASLGYKELGKQREELARQQIKDNGAVAGFNAGRGGVNESELDKGTRVSDAHALSIARQTDAYAELQAGLTNLPGYYEKVRRIQEAEDNTVKNLTKSNNAAANAAERYGEQASSYLLQAQDQYVQLVAQLEGDSLGAKLAAIDRQYDSAASSISRSMIGAKGSTEAARAALDQLEKNRAVAKKIAEADAWKKSMQDAANMLGELGRLSGDPSALYGSAMTTAQAWEAEQQKRINAIQDETEKTKQLGELQQVMALKELEARKQAYEGIAGVSDQYWEAERARIEQHLATVKQNATDETAYKIYAAQQWDAYNKALLERQEQYAGTFAETFAAKWALTFGTYKSAATQAKETWEQTSQSIIDATNSVIDGVAGGVGDMVRSFADGTGSIESLIQNMRSRILDMFASMIEELIRKWLTDFVGRLGSGDGISLGSLFGSSSSSGGGVSLSSLTGSGGSSGSGLDLSSFTSLGKWIGKETGSSLVDSLSSSSSGLSMVIGDAPDIGASIGKELASYGDVWNAGSDMWSAGESFAEWSSGSFTSAASTAGSLSSMLSSTLGIVGALGGVFGLVSSLFSSSEKTEKTGSGYKIAINAGTLNMSGVDFYKTTRTSGFGGTSTSYSTVSTGMVDPDVAKQVNDTLKETAEQLHDFAKTLGFSVDILDSFSMPEMTITDSQLQSYMRNTSNAMAFSALDEAGLRGAFDFVADKYEVYVDEFKRLADAYKLVGGYTEAYGYDLETLAGITADQIAEIRQVNTETAQGTAQAVMNMATAMGATSDQLAELAANASDGSQALAVTDEQLSKILQADYASKLVDAVGGEDAFQTLMTNLVKHTLDSVQAYEENATYYAGKAGEAIEELGRSGVTIANFWDQFDQAMHGALSVEEFEKWADAAGWVNALNVVTDALDDWADTVAKAYQSLDVRAMQAQGLDYQAELAELLANAEWELVAAREAGYDAAYLSRLAEVQALEYTAKIAEHAEDYAHELREAQKRYATAIDDSGTLVTLAIQENQAELQKLAKEYNWSPGSAEEELFQTVQQAQWAEIINMIQETADATAEATRAMRADLDARRATIAGYDEEAEALQMVAGFADELAQAYADGIDPGLITDLMSVQMDELAKYWADTLDQMESDLRDLYQTQSDLLNSLTGNTQSAIEELYGLFERYQAGETDLADSIIDSLQAIANAVNDMVEDIYSTIYEIRTGEDYRTDTADVAAANAKSYFEEQYAKAAAGDTEAMSNITSYATSYLSTLKSSTADESVYRSGVDWITSMLSQLATSGTGIGGGLTEIGEIVTDGQIEAAREALRRAEVAQAKSKADALLAQAQSALQGSDIGNYIAAFATTGVGWQGVAHLLDSNTPDGTANWLASMRAGNASIQDIISWFVQYYGTGTGYVDWASAVPYVANLGILPSGVSSLYQSYKAAQDAYLALKSQYGFALGGVISSPSTAGDNTLVFANGGERVLTPRQNDAFEELVFGGGQGGGRLVEALIARVDRLTDAVDAAKKANTEENRAMARRLTSIASQVDDWALNGSLQVGVKGPVEVTGTVEVAP